MERECQASRLRSLRGFRHCARCRQRAALLALCFPWSSLEAAAQQVGQALGRSLILGVHRRADVQLLTIFSGRAQEPETLSPSCGQPAAAPAPRSQPDGSLVSLVIALRAGLLPPRALPFAHVGRQAVACHAVLAALERRRSCLQTNSDKESLFSEGVTKVHLAGKKLKGSGAGEVSFFRWQLTFLASGDPETNHLKG